MATNQPEFKLLARQVQRTTVVARSVDRESPQVESHIAGAEGVVVTTDL